MDKKIYDVSVVEVWIRALNIEARSEDEAREIANNLIESGAADGEFEYSHTLDIDEWNVSDITDMVATSKEKYGFEIQVHNKLKPSVE